MSTTQSIFHVDEDFGSNDNELEQESNDKAICKGGRRSHVWTHFEKVNDKAVCNECHKELASKNNSGTSHLKNHLDSCPVRKRKRMEDSASSYTFDADVSRRLLAYMIVVHEYPLNMVEHEWFKKYSYSLNPDFKVVTRNTIKSDVFKIYEFEKEKTMKVLEKNIGKIAITTNMWTCGGQKKGYMAVTAHFVDDSWVLQSRILRFLHVRCPHTADVLLKALMDCFLDWNTDGKLSALTVDNCSTNDRMLKLLLDKFSFGDLMCGGKLFHMRCFAHILNLVVKDGLEVISEGIGKIRDSISYWTASPKRVEKFEESARQINVDYSKKLALDCTTRWNSTFLMLKAAFPYKGVFTRLKFREKNYTCAPDDYEWEFAGILIEKLHVFYEVTKLFSGTKYPTTNEFFPSICDVKMSISDWVKSDREDVKLMATKMLEKFDKYWDVVNGTMGVATILDPRYKMRFIEWAFPLIYGNESSTQVARIQKLCEDLVTEYKMKLGGGTCSFDECSSCIPSHLGVSSSSTFNSRMSQFDLYVSEDVSTEKVVSELDLYLEDKLLPRNNPLDILSWWKTHGFAKYPTLSAITRDLLAIPVSTVASESVFSTSGRVLDPHRCRLLSETMEKLLCTQHWMKATMGDGGFKSNEKEMEMEKDPFFL